MLERAAGRRPIVLAALCYLAGAVAGGSAGLPVFAWALGLTLAGIVVFWKRGAALFAALVFLAATAAAAHASRPMPQPAEGVVLAGTVLREPAADERRTVLTLDAVSLDGAPTPWNVRVYAYEPVVSRPGDRVTMTVDLWAPEGQRNPHGFDFAAWCRRQRVLCASMHRETARVEPGPPSARTLLRDVRGRIGASIDAAFDSAQAPLVRALIIGDREQLPEQINDNFQRSGVAHILSVSGLHVTCLAFALDALLRRMLPRGLVFGLMAALLAFYAALVGFGSPVIRSVLMYLAVRFAPMDGRPSDALSGLAAAMLLILAADPLAAGDVGFILSFSAMAGLILLGRPIERVLGANRLPRVVRFFATTFAASIAASVAILPACANQFGALQIYGPLTNLLAVPLATAALPLAFLAALVQMLWPAAGAVVAFLPALALRCLTAVIDFAAHLPRATLPMAHFPWWLCALWGAMVFALSDHAGLPAARRRWIALSFPAAAALAILLGVWSMPGGLAFDFLSVGAADAAVVYAQGHVYLVDAGEDGSAADYLAKSAGRPSAMFLTHPHADHIGGAGAVQSLYPDVTVYVPECWLRVEGAREAARQAGLEGPLIGLSAGDEVRLSEDVRAVILYPPAGLEPKDANAASLVMEIVGSEGSALFTGDLEDAIAIERIPDTDILKAAHHGADIRAAELLLRASSPGVVVISAGRSGSAYSSRRFIERASKNGAQIYQTHLHGMLRAWFDESGATAISPFRSPKEDT